MKPLYLAFLMGSPHGYMPHTFQHTTKGKRHASQRSRANRRKARHT
jgi:hypothetical protein